MSNDDWTPVTLESCNYVKRPFYHGTKFHLEIGAMLIPGFVSNFEEGRISNNVYFTALLEPAVWGAELSTAFAGLEERGHIYIVEPTGTFEDDPNLTNKRFPGNLTQSYRTRHPVKIVGKVNEWAGHSPEVLQQMLDGLKEKMRKRLAAIED